MTDVKIRCDDCKFVENCVDYGWQECKKFTPKPSEPMTNEEWLKKANTEQLAEFIKKIAMNCGYCIDGGSPISCPLGDGEFCVMGGTGYAFENAKTFVEWLKQPHTPKE